jgi:hypothetical protein
MEQGLFSLRTFSLPIQSLGFGKSSRNHFGGRGYSGL